MSVNTSNLLSIPFVLPHIYCEPHPDTISLVVKVLIGVIIQTLLNILSLLLSPPVFMITSTTNVYSFLYPLPNSSYFLSSTTRLPNDPMLNIWLNIENNSSKKRNQKSRNVMLQPMHSYDCGINLRSESSLVLSDLLFA